MSILSRIVEDTRGLVAARRREMPPRALEERPLFASPRRRFEAALRQPGLGVIAELKKASPSKGVIRPDFDVVDLARQYEAAGASAISVLTEPLYFQGAPEYLAAVREAVDVPLLRKDFIIDSYQLVEARAFGADAVLLIAAVLDRAQLHDLHETAHALGLACLVEVYDAEELDKIDFDEARILGVNNRDLRTFAVDVDHSLRVFGQVPEDLVRVSESGLRSAAELAHLRRHGVDAALMGETLMRADRPGQHLKALLGELQNVTAA